MLLNRTPTSAWNCIRLNPRREYFSHSFNKDLLTIYYVAGSLWIFEIHQEQMIKPPRMKLILYSQWLFFAYSVNKKINLKGFLGSSVVKTPHLWFRGVKAPPLVQELLRSHMPHGMAKQLNRKETQTMNLNNSMARKTVTSLLSFENKQEKSRHNQCSLSPSLWLSIPSRQNLGHLLEKNF